MKYRVEYSYHVIEIWEIDAATEDEAIDKATELKPMMVDKSDGLFDAEAMPEKAE